MSGRPSEAVTGTAGQAGMTDAGDAAARRGDLVLVHLRRLACYRDRLLLAYDEVTAAQVTTVMPGGKVHRYRPAGEFAAGPDAPGDRDEGRPLPGDGFGCVLVISARCIDVPGALATAACRVWPGHEARTRSYDSLAEAGAALEPHLPARPGGEQLRAAARTWHAARTAALLLHGAASARWDQFRDLFQVYDAAVAAANTACCRACEQAAEGGDAR